MKTLDQDRRGWVLVSILLLAGFLCVFAAAGWAIRFPSSWMLEADMGSHLDPNSEYLTLPANPVIQPLDPSILTQPVWIEIFLTPGATLPTRVPVNNPPTQPFITPTTTNIAFNASVTPTAALSSPTPTNTIIYSFPVTYTPTSAPASPKPPNRTPTALSTSPPPAKADLQITKTDGGSTYAANGTLTYTVTVSNLGPTQVTGAVVQDALPPQISSWNWACTSVSGGASGCKGMNGSSSFTNTVNLPSGSVITYTVNASISAGASGDLVNTASVSVPVGTTDPVPANNTATDTNSPGIDLQITKTDGASTYTPGSPITYTVVVTNNSSFPVNGAVVTDNLPAQLSAVSWSCLPAAGASCTPGGVGNISDAVNLPPGLQVTYTIVANISSLATGSLVNTASVTTPAGFVDVAPANNSATDTNTSLSGEPDVGLPDGSWYTIPPGSALVIMISPAIAADGDVGTPDFVYYERLAAPTNPTSVELDWVQVEISQDGSTWYQVFYWGDPGGSPDVNTNVDVQNSIGDLCATEVDNCAIPQDRLYNFTGITVDIDGLVPPGTYPWMRISAPASPDSSEVDAIQPYYP